MLFRSPQAVPGVPNHFVNAACGLLSLFSPPVGAGIRSSSRPGPVGAGHSADLKEA